MTKALTMLNNADELEEAPEPTLEAPPARPTDPVIQEPASVPPSRIAKAVELARKRREERQAYVNEQRDNLEATLSASEPDRVEIQNIADEIINSVVADNPEAKAVTAVTQQLLAERQEVLRGIREAIGITVSEANNVGADLETYLTELVGGYGAMREAIRLLCAKAGTIRVDKLEPVKSESGQFNVIRRFVDVGDEEPDQTPILDLEWLIPAVIKAGFRFEALRHEHGEAVKRSASVVSQINDLQIVNQALHKQLTAANAQLGEMSTRVKEQRSYTHDSPTGYYIRSDSGRWLCLAPTKGATCFLTKYKTTLALSEAHAFESADYANEVLLRLQMARYHRVRKSTRETLKVVAVRFEDFTIQ